MRRLLVPLVLAAWLGVLTFAACQAHHRLLGVERVIWEARRAGVMR